MFVRSRSNWNLEVLVFEERGKPEYAEKNLSEQGREPTTNSTHIGHWDREWNPGHIGGRRALSPLRHPCSPKSRQSQEREKKKKRQTEMGKFNPQFFVVDQEDGDVGQQNFSQPAFNGPDIGMGVRREKAVFTPTG